MPFQTPTDGQKERVWQAYREGRPTRVPLTLGINPRTYLLDPSLNTDGITMEQAQCDPKTHIEVCLRWQLHNRTVLHRYCDHPTELPEEWVVSRTVYNIFEAAFFGAPVVYLDGQVPDTVPVLSDDNKWDIFNVDIEHPLEHGFFKQCLDFRREMERICEDYRFEGRSVRVAPYVEGTDGPLTVACNLRGMSAVTDLIEDPEYAERLMSLITRAAIIRRRAFADYWGDRINQGNGMADDSCALISEETYKQQVMRHHRNYYDAGPAGDRGMHLCGDATHLFPTMRRELNITSFDTGFPVDHGMLRRQLGPDVEILGGVEVPLLMESTPDQVYERARDILLSGVKEGGRFIMREGNNLPPACPLANLEAMYAAVLDFGEC